jgi:hypothetical protein
MLAPPKPPPREHAPEALIPEARERQRRRRLVVATSVASVAGLVLLIQALFAGSGARGSRSDAAGAPAPACRASQLSFSANGVGMGMNGIEVQWHMTDIGGHACALPAGLPIAAFILPGGKPIPITQAPVPPSYDAFGRHTNFGRRAGRILEPGRKYFSILFFSDLVPGGSCTTPMSRSVTVALRYSDGLLLSVPETPQEPNAPEMPCSGGNVRVSPLLHEPS